MSQETCPRACRGVGPWSAPLIAKNLRDQRFVACLAPSTALAVGDPSHCFWDRIPEEHSL
jgi:hypothetical protein